MNCSQRINAFKTLGKSIEFALSNPDGETGSQLLHAVSEAEKVNPWFVKSHSEQALLAIAAMLKNIEHSDFEKRGYVFSDQAPKTVAIVMAGNIPLVGFQDFAHVLISGHKALCKMSSDDSVLLPVIADLLCRIEPDFSEHIRFSEGKISDFDAVIATGSNNTSRYFEYYFSKYPHIIRKNRNSVAVLTGKESPEDLMLLADDMFSYFGFGCRNVTTLFVPENYEFEKIILAASRYSYFQQHHKYMNNYDYYKAIYIINSAQYIDGGFFILVRSDQIATPPGIIHYITYRDISSVVDAISQLSEQLQCVISESVKIKGAIGFGLSQSPDFFDFADGVDTLKFLDGL